MALAKKLIKKAISCRIFGFKKLQFARTIIQSRFTPGLIKKMVIDTRKYFPRLIIPINFNYDSKTCGKFLLDLRSYCDREIFFDQFEPATYRLYASLLERCQYKSIWDIGSNIGFYTILAGIKLGKEGEVYAFEPMKETFRRLEKNVELNGLQNIKLFNIALASKDGLQEIYTLDVEQVTSSPTLNKEWAKKNNFVVGDQVVTRNVSQMLSTGELKRPNIIKIDVETLEPEILGTIKDLLKGPDAPDIICELMPPTIDSLNKLLLEECGYRLYHINLNGAQEVKELTMRRPFNDYFFTKKPDFIL